MMPKYTRANEGIEKAASAVLSVKKPQNGGPSAINYVINTVGKKSLTRMARDTIFQFPSIISSSIDTDEIGVIMKATEQTYATMLMSVMSVESSVDRDKYPSMIDYLRTFHTNGYKFGRDDNSLMSVESWTISCEGIHVDEAIMRSLWDNTEDLVDMESLNDIYRPYTRTKRMLSDRYELMMATEATAKQKNNKLTVNSTDTRADRAMAALRNKPSFRNVVGDVKAEQAGATNSGTASMGGQPGFLNTMENPRVTTTNTTVKFKDPKTGNDTTKVTSQKTAKDVYLDLKGKNELVNVDKLNNMVPTVINISLTNYKSGSGIWSQTLTLGVKCMPRLVKSSVMVANMIDAAKDQAIFKFIKWTKGELKLHDLIFGISTSKDASKAVKGKWLSALKRRRVINSVSKWVGQRLLPNCTIILTEAEAEQVKAACGVDLHDRAQAKKIMSKYFLLGIGIYDTEAKIYNVIYDSDEAYQSYPMRGLIALTKKEIKNTID